MTKSTKISIRYAAAIILLVAAMGLVFFINPLLSTAMLLVGLWQSHVAQREADEELNEDLNEELNEELI